MGDVVAAAIRFSCLHLTDYDCSGEAAVGATSNLDSLKEAARTKVHAAAISGARLCVQTSQDPVSGCARMGHPTKSDFTASGCDGGFLMPLGTKLGLVAQEGTI